jgi:hypothetical protein
MHTASFKRTLPEAANSKPEQPAVANRQVPRKAIVAASKPTPDLTKSATPGEKSGDKKFASLTAKSAPRKTVDKAASAPVKPVTKQPKLAKSDPLAPRPASKASKPAKDSRQKP